jgi:hypothetical protein
MIRAENGAQQTLCGAAHDVDFGPQRRQFGALV